MIINSPEGSAAKNCVPQETYINDVKLAHAYVPRQKLCDTYTPLGSLMRGTAFPSIYDISGWDPRQTGVYDDE